MWTQTIYIEARLFSVRPSSFRIFSFARRSTYNGATSNLVSNTSWQLNLFGLLSLPFLSESFDIFCFFSEGFCMPLWVRDKNWAPNEVTAVGDCNILFAHLWSALYFSFLFLFSRWSPPTSDRSSTTCYAFVQVPYRVPFWGSQGDEEETKRWMGLFDVVNPSVIQRARSGKLWDILGVIDDVAQRRQLCQLVSITVLNHVRLPLKAEFGQKWTAGNTIRRMDATGSLFIYMNTFPDSRNSKNRIE